MAEPSRLESGRDPVSGPTAKACVEPVDMGVPLRRVLRNQRRRRLGLIARSVARGVGGSFGFVVRFLLAGDGDDDDD